MNNNKEKVHSDWVRQDGSGSITSFIFNQKTGYALHMEDYIFF